MAIQTKCSKLICLLSMLMPGLSWGQTLADLTAAVPQGVTAIEEIDRFMFVTTDGMPLYILDDDREKPGTSACEYGGKQVAGGLAPHCAWRWPPLFAPPDAKPIGDWTLIIRPEGKPQWAYKNMPVYLSEEDLRPGVDSGDNVGNRWHTLAIPRLAPRPALPPGLKVVNSKNEWILTDHIGRILYTITGGGERTVEHCEKECLAQLTMLRAPMVARPVGDWTVVKHSDGTKQWAYKGQPIYTYNAPGVPSAQLLAAVTSVTVPN